MTVADISDRPAQRRVSNAWAVVAGQELRTLWWSGRGLTMMLAYTALLSLSTYLVASNQELNFLEQREAVNITLAIAVVVGGFLVLLVAADSISGERERGTLEVLLLTPAPRTGLLIGKGIAALSMWIAAFVLALPYLWWLGRDVGTFPSALFGGLLVGSLVSCILVGLGLLVSTLSMSNGLSLALSVFALIALLVPRQMPAEATRGWAGEALMLLDPLAAGLLYLDRVILNGHSLGQDARLLVAPAVLAVVLPAAALAMSGTSETASAERVVSRALSATAALALAFVTAVVPAAISSASEVSNAPSELVVELDRSTITVGPGERFGFESAVTNTGQIEATQLTAHLNILTTDPAVYVDPEDWSAERTQYIDNVSAGETIRLDWSVQAVTSGPLVLYVAVTDLDTGSVVSSGPLELTVEGQRVVESAEVMPLVIWIPVGVLALLGATLLRRRLAR